jgi:hypothetical protein
MGSSRLAHEGYLQSRYGVERRRFQGCRTAPPARRSGAGFRPQDQLRAPEQRQGAPAGLVGDHRIPNLSRAAQMLDLRRAGDAPLPDRAERVALQLQRRERFGAVGQMGDGGVAAGGVGQGDDAG